MFIRFDRMYERDRQTDRHTEGHPHDGIGRAYASHREAKREEKLFGRAKCPGENMSRGTTGSHDAHHRRPICIWHLLTGTLYRRILRRPSL